MRSLILLTATCAVTLAQLPDSSQILTIPQVEQLEAEVTKNPADAPKSKLLGENYGFIILGVTSLSNTGLVTHFDPQISSSPFAAHAREALGVSTNATLLGEAGIILWNGRMGGPGATVAIDDRKQLGTLAEQTLSRAIDINGSQDRWRSLRITMKISDVHFSGVPADQAYAQVREDLAALSGDARYYALAAVAELAFKAGKMDDAASLASELLAVSTRRPSDWNKGNAVHAGNMVLGEVALRRGDLSGAEAFLIAAGATGGSPQLNSFGPNMSLALDLLKAGDSKAVLQYLDECRLFWKMGGTKLEQWSQDVKQGKTPQFGANLVY